jgi:hypothetical protein
MNSFEDRVCDIENICAGKTHWSVTVTGKTGVIDPYRGLSCTNFFYFFIFFFAAQEGDNFTCGAAAKGTN